MFIKRILEKQAVFNATLRLLAFLGQRPFFDFLTKGITSAVARLNTSLNRPPVARTTSELADRWMEMMPPDGQEHFKVTKTDSDTAFAEIHLHCPLRGTGDVQACYKLMNYDRKLMEKVGGQLIVLESQSNSGKDHCKLAIRPINADNGDLTPAHERD